MEFFYYSSSKNMKLHKVVKTDKILGRYHQKWGVPQGALLRPTSLY